MKNFTGGENPQTIAELSCSVEFTGEVHGEFVFLSVINTFLSITAFLGNTLILVALRKDTSIHPPSKLLYRNLAITDLCVGIIVEPLSVAYWISVVNGRWDICYYAYLTRYFASVTLWLVSLMTLTAISVTSQRPSWSSRTKAFLSSGSNLYFHVNSSRKQLYCTDPQHGCLVTRLQTKNTHMVT